MFIGGKESFFLAILKSDMAYCVSSNRAGMTTVSRVARRSCQSENPLVNPQRDSRPVPRGEKTDATSAYEIRGGELYGPFSSSSRVFLSLMSFRKSAIGRKRHLRSGFALRVVEKNLTHFLVVGQLRLAPQLVDSPTLQQIQA